MTINTGGGWSVGRSGSGDTCHATPCFNDARRPCPCQAGLLKRLQHRKKGRRTRDCCSKNARALPLRSSSLVCSPKLIYGIYIIESAEGSQQGDSLSGHEFCETVHSTLSKGSSRSKLGLWTTSTWREKSPTWQKTFNAQATTGLVLNRNK